MEIQREDVTIPDNQAGLAFVLYNVLTPEVMPFINSIELSLLFMSALRLSWLCASLLHIFKTFVHIFNVITANSTLTAFATSDAFKQFNFNWNLVYIAYFGVCM